MKTKNRVAPQVDELNFDDDLADPRKATDLKKGDILIKHFHGSGMMDAIIGGVIRTGQSLDKNSPEKQYAGFIHAGIATGQERDETSRELQSNIIEMSGDGLVKNDLFRENAKYKYDVFRCKLRDLAHGAANTADMMHRGIKSKTNKDGFKIKYSIWGAVKSLLANTNYTEDDRINAMLDKLVAGKSESFFCSGHVVYCYLVALEQTMLLRKVHKLANWNPEKMAIANPIFDLAEPAPLLFEHEAHNYSPALLYERLNNNPHFEFVGTVKEGRLI